MTYSSLFIINSHGEFEINKEEVLKIKEYKVLLDRDKGSIGDNTGRKKLIASGELYYIYLVYDFRSIYSSLPQSIKEEKAREDSKLPPNWKEDEDFNKAVIRYKDDLRLTAAGNAFIVAEKIYWSSTDDTHRLADEVIALKELLYKKLAITKTKKVEKLGEVELAGIANEYLGIIGQITELQKKMMTNIKGFKELGETVKILAAKFAEEGGSMKTPVGGGELGNRED